MWMSRSCCLARSKQMSMCARASASGYSYQGRPPTTSQRLVEQFGGAWIAHDPFLRKGDHLDVAKAGVFLAHEQQSLRGAQAADRSDVGEQAEERRSILDSGLDHAPGALRHLLRIVFALE